MSVTDIMLAAASPDPSVRGPAEQMIFDARASDLPNFLVALVQELRNSDKPIESRQMAGLVLKNSVAFAAREVELKKQLEDIWRGVPAETRSYVKDELMAALESNEAIVRRTVALAIANLARIELPADEWPTLIETLCGAVASGSVEWMEAGLTTLGYVCEECIGNGPLTATLAQYAEQILGAIFQGLYFENPTVKYNAINALCNAIDFIGAQMKDPSKSGPLFEAICATASSSDSETSAKALETLVVVARLYYETLGDHMNALWAVTMAAIQQADDESPALQGIQFWIAIAEVEAEMMKEGEPHQAYVTNWLTDLFQMVVWALQKQDPNQTEDDWNVSNAASKLLVAMAEAAGDNIVPVAMEFVSANLQSENWRLREASVLVFGAILHGPTPGSLEQTVAETVETICGYLSDKVPLVVDTSGWALSLIAAEYSSVLLSPTFLGPVLGAVMPLFNYHHLLVTRAAAIIHNLCLYFDDDDDDNEGEAQTNELSSCYADICQALLSALDRPDLPDQCKHDVQEALNRLFGAAAPDSFNVLYDLVPLMLHRLHTASEATKNGGGPELEITQGLIVGSLNHIARRIKPNMVPLLPDVVNGLTHMFDCARDGSVLAEGIMCIGALALAARRDFVPWLETIHTFVQAAITSIDDYDLCITGISTIGDIAAGCEGGIEPMLPETMSNFFTALSNPELDDDLLGPIISCLGDIALNAAPQFQPYLDQAVQAVAAVDAESRTEQLQEGHNANTDETIGGLWENILSFGTGIVQGFAENLEPVLPHLPYLLDFVLHAALHMQDDADIIKGCVTLLGDMANAIRHGPPEYHASARDSLCVNAVQQILSNAMDFDDELVTGAAEWAGKELRHLSNC